MSAANVFKKDVMDLKWQAYHGLLSVCEEKLFGMYFTIPNRSQKALLRRFCNLKNVPKVACMLPFVM